MQKKDKIILWPIYFDSTKTRTEGRRVPKKLAMLRPNLEEIKKAAELLGFNPLIVQEVAYPSMPWQKIGLVTIPKNDSKTQVIRKIAQKILEKRKKS